MKQFFTNALMEWNDNENTRSMPWKGEKDPYRIWLSEIILQQTRVEQGWAYYEKFILNYPTVQELAAAPEEAAFRLWQGLGYYARCKNMLAAARQIASQYHGHFPNTYDTIQSLKGVGPYTAAAIASFAFNLPHAVLDGNVFRVLSRFFDIDTPIDTTAGKNNSPHWRRNCFLTENQLRITRPLWTSALLYVNRNNPPVKAVRLPQNAKVISRDSPHSCP
ncbi:hypothetical protein [Chitinophaga pinensis]|uniref:hypothetical protein n=1 Tax=Chitinophaga pinensis TaxID=79329 RepID=UPI0021BD047F|nr:hypothetical protein [Chitinophaga pinensis]